MKRYRTYANIVTYAIAVFVLLTAAGCGPDPVDVARQYIDVKMYDKAESMLRDEIKKSQDNEGAHLMLGRCLLEAGREEEAARELDAAVVINENLAGAATEIYLESARRLLATGGDIDRAVAYLTRVVAMSAKSSGEIAELCMDEAAKRVTVPGGSADTLMLFDTALKLNPKLRDDIAKHCFEGAKKIAEDDSATAAEYAEYAMGADPAYAEDVAALYRQMALAKYDDGNVGLARDHAERAVKLNAELAEDARIRKVLTSENMDRNEGRVVAVLERVAAAEEAFAKGNNGRYASVDELKQASAAAGLQGLLESMESDGYVFEIIVSPIGANFYVAAAPKEYEESGIKSYFVDSSGVVRSGDLEGKMPSARPGDERFGGDLPEAQG
jgi:tetratricopeptide (TPR) repeat protein